MIVAGVDGSKYGWVAVALSEGAVPQCVEAKSLQEIVDRIGNLAVIAIDMPIGLPESGHRECDIEARRALGRRRNSVFWTPTRQVLDCDTYDAANAAAKAAGSGLSKQAFALRGKIHEVARLCERPDAAVRVYEVHPELCWQALNNGNEMEFHKATAAGNLERLTLINREFGAGSYERLAANCVYGSPDDLLDAFVAAWTAQRIRRGEALAIASGFPTMWF